MPGGRHQLAERVDRDVEPEEPLEQHTRYQLVVTRGVRDITGNPVVAAPGFGGTYSGLEVAVSSVFTTFPS